jgi:hypothetical protein
MDMKHINYETFKQQFLATDMGQQIQQDYDVITCSANNWPSIVVAAHRWSSTPRQLCGDRAFTPHPSGGTEFSIVPFYYINQLLEQDPREIVDIGCGWNIFKKYIPRIRGIDAMGVYADQQATYSSKFVSEHQQRFSSVMSINLSWHMGLDGSPTNLINLAEHVKEFSSLVAPGGRGFLALSALGIMKYTPRSWFQQHQLSPFEVESLEQYVTEQLSSTGLKLHCLDLELDLLYNMPSHDGEIRMVFEP